MHMKMLRALEALLDAIMPLRARSMRTRARRVEDFVLSPTAHDLLGMQITTLMEYREQSVKDLIHSLKYDRSQYAAKIAATILEEYLLEEIASHRQFSQKKVLIIPVPLHKSRSRERGFNQIALVIDALSGEFRNGPLSYKEVDILKRTRETNAQTLLPRPERLSNVAGAFAVTNPASIDNTHIFLIDDVTTTGATLVNAATPLRRAGASVSLLALARA